VFGLFYSVVILHGGYYLCEQVFGGVNCVTLGRNVLLEVALFSEVLYDSFMR